MRHAIAKATSLYHNSAQQITSTTKPCDSWPSSHVRTFVWFVIIIAFPIHHALSRSQLPSLTHVFTTTTTISSLTYVCVCYSTQRPKRTVPVAYFSSQYPYHIFLMCVQFPHSQNNHHTHTHVRTVSYIDTHIHTDSDWHWLHKNVCHGMPPLELCLFAFGIIQRHQPLSDKSQSKKWRMI